MLRHLKYFLKVLYHPNMSYFLTLAVDYFFLQRELQYGGLDNVGKLFGLIQTEIIFLQFVMKAGETKDELDYEEDVDNLKRVWAEIKAPNPKKVKDPQAKTQSATQTKLPNQSKAKQSQEKKPKVLISEPNMKQTVRNPKPKPGTVIDVVTHPENKRIEPLRNERNFSAPNHLVLTNPQRQTLGDIQSLRKQIADKDYELSLLRVSNTHNEDKVRRLEGQIEEKDRIIDDLKAKERYLTSQLAELSSRDFNFNYGKVQYQNYRQDSRRLLKILKSTAEYKTFAEFALEDDGVRFLTNANNTVKTRLDAPSDQNHFHFCTCNKAFIPESALWVPEKVYDFGRDFIKDRKGDLSQTELQLLLYQLNKLWRERQKRILNHVNALKANEIGKYKRKLSNSKGTISKTALKAQE